VLDERGIAQRGLLVRHLVMPHGIAGTGKVLQFLADEISANTYLNLMDQYQPCYRADEFPQLDRPITREQHREALAIAAAHGLTRLDRRMRYDAAPRGTA
jgi:putative pyruvate formate lyase activating enzyme